MGEGRSIDQSKQYLETAGRILCRLRFARESTPPMGCADGTILSAHRLVNGTGKYLSNTHAMYSRKPLLEVSECRHRGGSPLRCSSGVSSPRLSAYFLNVRIKFLTPIRRRLFLAVTPLSSTSYWKYHYH